MKTVVLTGVRGSVGSFNMYYSKWLPFANVCRVWISVLWNSARYGSNQLCNFCKSNLTERANQSWNLSYAASGDVYASVIGHVHRVVLYHGIDL